MRVFLFFILIVLIDPVGLRGQDITFSGIVVDSRTQEPLPNAAVGILDRSIGTVANAVGEFEFNIPASFINDTVFISFIGYKTFKERVSNIQKYNGKMIPLDEAVTVLREITVGDKRLGARSIVEDALREAQNVYPTTPYLMDVFQRSWEKMEFVDSLIYPGKLLESAGVIYDPGYARQKGKKMREEVFVKEMRRTQLREGWVNRGDMSDMSVEAIKTLLFENQVKYQNEITHIYLKGVLHFPNSLNYELEKTSQIDGDLLYTIRVDVPNARSFPAYYRLYISQKDMAILRLELRGSKKVELTGLPYQTIELNETYTYRRFNGRVYLNYAKIQYTLNRVDPVKKKVVQVEDYFRELMINDINLANVETKRSELAKATKEVKGYNKEFWKKYNIIQENPLDKELIRIFEKGGKLENQFENADYDKVKKKDLH